LDCDALDVAVVVPELEAVVLSVTVREVDSELDSVLVAEVETDIDIDILGLLDTETVAVLDLVVDSDAETELVTVVDGDVTSQFRKEPSRYPLIASVIVPATDPHRPKECMCGPNAHAMFEAFTEDIRGPLNSLTNSFNCKTVLAHELPFSSGPTIASTPPTILHVT